MTWAKLDDRFPFHSKVGKLSDASFRVHVSAICCAAGELTDGKIEPAWKRPIAWRDKDVAELINAGVWEVREDGSWWIHDFLEYHPSREQVAAKKGERSSAGRIGGLAKAANTNRDRARRLSAARQHGTHTDEEWQEMVDAYRGQCLACGVVPVVRDHITPLYKGGGDTIQNIQPLCRSCNSGKSGDTTDFRIGRAETLSKWLAVATDGNVARPVPSRPSSSLRSEDLSVADAPRETPVKAPKKTEPTEEWLDEIAPRYAGLRDFREAVAFAMNSDYYRRKPDKRAYILGALDRALEREAERIANAPPGRGSRPVPPDDEYSLAALDARIAAAGGAG